MAASSSSLGMPRMYCTIKKTKNALPNAHGRIMASSVSLRWSFFRIMYCGTTMTCAGIIMVMMMQPNQKLAPKNLTRDTA